MALLLRILDWGCLHWLAPLREIGYVSELGNLNFPLPTSLEGWLGHGDRDCGPSLSTQHYSNTLRMIRSLASGLISAPCRSFRLASASLSL